jgi:hypothetical protein
LLAVKGGWYKIGGVMDPEKTKLKTSYSVRYRPSYQSVLRPMRHQSRDNAFLLAERVLQVSHGLR